jgi:hypothetical protein
MVVGLVGANLFAKQAEGLPCGFLRGQLRCPWRMNSPLQEGKQTPPTPRIAIPDYPDIPAPPIAA